MKTAAALLHACASLAVIANLAQARQMHSGLDYTRYLQDADAVEAELDAWMDKYKDAAEKNGWLPAAESRDAEAVKEDRKQRFFMAKELVTELTKQNPDAQFTTDSPFSLLTTDEFAKYIKNSYISGGGRMLRAANGAPTDSNDTGEGNAPVHPSKTPEIGSEGSSGGASTPAPAPKKSLTFQDLVDWITSNSQPATQPTKRPSDEPTSRPSPSSTPAPVVAPTKRPVGPVAPTNRPVGPVAPTSRPGPVVAPTNRPVGPVAPTNRPVGPVAPIDNVTKKPSPGGDDDGDDIAADGNGIDWSTNKCMPPIQNQGQCGSCWAFATVAGLETGKCIAEKASSFVKLSEQNVATCDTRNMGCNGGATSYAYQYIQKTGVCSQADVPYTMGNGRQAACAGGCQKIPSGIKSTPRVSGESGLVSTLATHPVVIAVAAGNNAWKQYAGGVLSSCETTRPDHAVLAVGYDASSIKIRNSWGANWGEKGYMRIKRGGGGQGVCAMYSDMIHATF